MRLCTLLAVVLLSGMVPKSPPDQRVSLVCPADPDPPAYYKFDLVTTKRVPGSGRASGVGAVSYKATPFGISLGVDGSYHYKLDISIENLQPAKRGGYVAWITTPNLDNVKHIGKLEDNHRFQTTTEWNKFLVVISLEDDPDAESPKWKGPIVLRGISRSGLMHTMAGHGPYENEPCAIYGY